MGSSDLYRNVYLVTEAKKIRIIVRANLNLNLFCSVLACGRGFYKSSSQDLQCSRCPTHSFSDKDGSSRCDCEDSYYRAPSDPPYVACTSESVMNLMVKDIA